MIDILRFIGIYIYIYEKNCKTNTKLQVLYALLMQMSINLCFDHEDLVHVSKRTTQR